MGLRNLCLVVIGAALAAPPVMATETVSYTYDARGRLTRVVHTGTVNNGVTVAYEHDKANNRKSVTTTGSSH